MKYLVFLLVFALPLSATAAVDNPTKVGWTPYAGFNISVDDPNGSTEETNIGVPLAAAFMIPSGRDTRWMLNVAYYDFELNASTQNIGQKVESLGIAGFFQKRWRWTRNFKPFFGIGLQINFDDITARHTVDADGFLTQAYPDRNETTYSAGLNMSHEWQMSESFDLGFNFQYLFSLKDAIEGPLAGISVMYRFGK